RRAIDRDPSIERYNEAKIQWTPRIKFEFTLEEGAIYTLRGPRQVGKTTLVKLLIKDHLERSDPKSVFYWTCDLITTPVELAEKITEYLKWAREQTEGRLLIALDEISEVQGWQRSIKYLVDTGMLRNTTLILTGSHAIDLKKSGERLPGRRGRTGKPLNKILLPMKFSEYVEAVDPALFEKIGVRRRDERQRILFDLIKGRIDPIVSGQLVHLEEINRLLERYLLTGGFPRTINELASTRSIAHETYSIYLQWILGDMAKWGREERKTKQIIRRLLETYTSQVSWYSITRHTDIGSHNTVAGYVEALEDSFVLNVVNKLDLPRQRPKYRSEKKIYFLDPFIFHSLRSWTFGFPRPFETAKEYLEEPENKSRLIEGVVHNHLARLAYGLYPTDTFHPADHVYFLKNKHEIDFVLKLERLIPIEVKYRKRFDPKDVPRLGRFREGLVLTLEDLARKEDRYTALPVGMFLLLI
ncbi:MAG: ATP-binding protein, partial [Methanobacteriota archaeon]